MKKRLLFDFDGTIADTAEAGLAIYNEIAQKYGYRVISKENLEGLKHLGVVEVAKQLKIPLIRLPSIITKIRKALRSEIASIQAIDGVIDALKALKEKGHELHIVSSNSAENIKMFLEHNGIQIFDGITSVLDLFGKDREISKLIRKKRWDPGSVMYVGDEVRDVVAAKKAEIASIAVTWGFNSRTALQNEAPDMLLDRPSALTSL